MTIYQVDWNEETNTVLIQMAGSDPKKGFVVAGTFEYDDEDIPLKGPYNEDHNIFLPVHNVLKRKLGVEDVPGIKIKLG